MNKNLIKIFISSANNFIFDGAELTQTRENLAKAIQKIRIADKKLFEVVINEKEINGIYLFLLTMVLLVQKLVQQRWEF